MILWYLDGRRQDNVSSDFSSESKSVQEIRISGHYEDDLTTVADPGSDSSKYEQQLSFYQLPPPEYIDNLFPASRCD